MVTHLITKARLEHWSVLGCPFLCYTSVICAQLDEIAQDRQTGDFGQVFDLWFVGRMEEPDEEDKGHGQDRDGDLI